MRLRTLLCVVAVLASAATATAATGSGYGGIACGLDKAPRDGWYAVHAPSNGAWSVDMVDDDACTLVAASPAGEVARSTDAGKSWTTVLSHTGGLGRVFGEGLGSKVVIGEAPGSAVGVLLSTDGGRTFTRRPLETGLPAGVDPGAAVVGVSGSHGHVLVVRQPLAIATTGVREPGAPTLFTLDTAGTFTPVAGSSTLLPVAAAYDVDASAIFVADSRPSPLGGVYRSTDGGASFTQVWNGSATINDLVVAPLQGNGRAVYIGTSAGVYDSVDGGGGWGQEGTEAVYAMRTEWAQAGLVVALFGSPVRVGRSPDAGAQFYLSDPGPPADCRGTTLSRTAEQPSYFLLGCADGRTYRYLSSGADFGAAVPPAGGPPPPNNGGGGGAYFPPAQDMQRLKTWKLPGVTAHSGSIAFDGELLYYGDAVCNEDPSGYCNGFTLPGTVHRMRARDGTTLPSVETGQHVFSLDVDRDRRTLFVQSSSAQARTMTATSLLGGKAAKLFTSDVCGAGYSDWATQYSWDPTLQVFWTFGHMSPDICLISRTGELVNHCTWAVASSSPFFNGPTNLDGGAAIAAAGDGTAYLELENDQTVLRVSRRCGIEGMFQHDPYSEVDVENDAITCDTNSFPESAIWLRDGDKKTIGAYEVPGAFCPLPTRTAVTSPGLVAMSSRTAICTTLTLPWGKVVAHADMALLVDSVPVALGKTDGAGRLCGAYVPAVHHRAGTPIPGAKSIQGVFLGNRSYRPSTGRGQLAVAGIRPKVVLPPVAAVPVAQNPPPHQPIQQPAPHVQAAIRQAQQTQAQAQGQANPAPQANPNPVVVAQQQEQPQLAYVTEGYEEAQVAPEYQMTRRRRTRDAPLPLLGLVAASMTACVAVALAYRPQRART